MSELWKQGFNDAIEWCNKYYKPFQPLKLPENFNHRLDAWSRGFGEGLITGRGNIIDSAYPGNIGFSVDNGNVKIFYPEGHPELNKQN